MADAEQSEAAVAGRGAVFLGFQGVAYNLFVLFFYVAIVRLLPQSSVGVVFGLQSLGALAAVFSSGWVQVAATRFIAEAFGEKSGEKASQWYITGLGVSCMIALAACAVILAAAPEVSRLLFSTAEYSTPVRLYAVDFFFSQLAIAASSGLQGRSLFGRYAGVYAVYGFLKLGFGIPLLKLGFGVDGVVYAWIISDVFQLAVFLYMSRGLLGARSNAGVFHALLSFGLPIIILFSFSALTSNVDRLTILKVRGTEELAVYGSMLTAAGAVGTVLNSIANAVLPSFSRLNAKGALTASSVTTAFRYYLVAAIPLVGLAAGVSKPLIALVLGSGYVSGWPAFTILVSTVGVVSFASIFSSAFYGAKDSKTPMRVQLASGAVFAATVVPLIYFYGVTGAALAYVAANMLSLTLLARALSKRGLFSLQGSLISKTLAVYLLVFAATLLSGYAAGFRTLYLPLYLAIGLAVAAASTKVLKLVGKEDVELIASVAPGRIRRWVAKLLAILT
ncbi:MAG: oligosaccharide flippase family protein [Thermoprotei archaeon]